MSYAIGYVIYGIPLNDRHDELISEWESIAEDEDGGELWFEDKNGPCGFTTVYSGCTNKQVGYCGVLLGQIDECSDVCLDKVSWKPTEEQKAEVKEAIEKLHPKLKECNDPIGCYIVWGTS